MGEVERLLIAEYHVYRHSEHGLEHVACDSYHIPDHLVQHVDVITPTVHFDRRIGTDRHEFKASPNPERADELRRKSLAKRQSPQGGIQGRPADQFSRKQSAATPDAESSLADCDQVVTPDCIRALYQIPKGSLAAANNTLGIVEY